MRMQAGWDGGTRHCGGHAVHVHVLLFRPLFAGRNRGHNIRQSPVLIGKQGPVSKAIRPYRHIGGMR